MLYGTIQEIKKYGDKLKSQKNAFWHALIITIIIFALGIYIGIVIENLRTEKIDRLYQNSEIDLLDIRLQSEIYSSGNFNCNLAITENIKFTNRVYGEAKKLGKYEKASRITDSIKLQHKKYDLLRFIILLNSIKIKEKCANSYYEVVYFYDYDNPSIEKKAKQEVFSKLLIQLKNKMNNEVLLIPISGDANLGSLKLFLEEHKIAEENLPVILIDRKIKVDKIQNIDDLLKYFE